MQAQTQSKQKVRAKAGYALVWVASALVIILILTAGLLSVSQSFAKRNINEYAEAQAYLTARAACDAVCQLLLDTAASDTVEDQPTLTALLPGTTTREVNDFSWQTQDGETTAWDNVVASYSMTDADTLTVTATATLGDRSSTVSRDIEISTTSDGEPPVTLRRLEGGAYHYE